jgi:hypothetical protein
MSMICISTAIYGFQIAKTTGEILRYLPVALLISEEER